jgi:Tfp pilus assembly protein PilF
LLTIIVVLITFIAQRNNNYQWNGYHGSNHRGITYLNKNQFEQAEKEFKGCFNQPNQVKYALYNLACTYSRWGKTDQSIMFLEKAIETDLSEGGILFSVDWYIDGDPDFDNIRLDPRYKKLLSNLKVPRNSPNH